MILCACGCGEEIFLTPNNKNRVPKYKRWHFQKAGLSNKGRRWTTNQITPNTLCGCGCGEVVPTHKQCGELRYCRSKDSKFYLPKHCPHIRGNKSHKWKGGRYKSSTGYIFISVPDHPDANKDGYVLEHRYVWEQAHGPLKSNEVVHHINGIRDDNRIENLIALSKSKHLSDHVIQRGGIPATKESRSKGGKLGSKARWHK
jgi:hypothetical protein